VYRRAVATFWGLLTAALTVALVGWIGDKMYPSSPKGLDSGAPPGAFVMVLAAWALGAFGGASITSYIAERSRILHGVLVGIVGAVGAWIGFARMPHPDWFMPTSFVVLPAASYLGALLGIQPLPGHLEGWIEHKTPDYSGKM
jgi:hypothetical protein